ncbi:MAG: putative repeat-like protein [Frankiales bacterium]|nr:putative repeat-like protein [Frankiales bacterium]
MSSRTTFASDHVAVIEPFLHGGIPTDESDRVRALGAWCADTADTVRGISNAISSGGVAGWHGIAATSCIESMNGIIAVTVPTANWLDDCAAAAANYALTLSGSTNRLSQLRQQLSTQKQSQPASGAQVTDSDPVSQALVAQFQCELEALQTARDQLIRVWTSTPPGLDPHRSGWTRVGHWAAGLAHPFVAFAEHPSLATFSGACGALVNDLSAVAMVLDFVCPPAAAVVWGVVVVAAAAKLLIDADRAMHGEQGVGWKSLAGDALGAVPVGGAKLGKALTLGKAATTEQIALYAETVKHARGIIATGSSDVSLLAPGGGMAYHEAQADGHSLLKHVDITDKSIWARRKTEPKLAAISVFDDRRAIEDSAMRALVGKETKVCNFLKGSKQATEIRYPLGRPAGRVHIKGAPDVVPASTVVMLLEKHPDSPVGFRIVTTFLDI